jgi:CRISPR-associated protein Csx10
MATEFILTLQLRSPLALHRTRASVQYVKTLDYIPGTALRGALAEAYLAEHGTPDDTFRALFLSERVQYGDLWPSVEGRRTTLLPTTAQACKRHGLKHGASLRDAILDIWASPEGSPKCPECGELLDRVSGYLCSVAPVESLAPCSRLRVNTAIERGTGTVARELLFTQHTLIGQRKTKDKPEPVLFQGVVRLADPDLKRPLDALLKSPLFLGSGRSRGLGEVEIKSWTEAPDPEPLSERWHKFNETAQRAGGDPNVRYFSLTLLSHLALRDGLLRPVLGEITPQHFELPHSVAWVHYPGSGRPVLFLNAITVPGWNAVLGLPKPDTVALARGSALLGRCDAGKEQVVRERLAQIEAEGVGERRSEGFGRVAVCYPIHYECWR